MLRSLALGLGVLSLFCAARAEALEQFARPAPEFPAGEAWINAKPLTLSRLRERRAVLLAFLNPANVNSLRAAKVLEEWSKLYGLDGLMVIGVLTPDYDFQKDPRLARAALKRWGLTFPVVLDEDRRIWKAYANDGWPAFYVLDHKGRISFDHLGEGGYSDIEAHFRSALEDVPGAGTPPFAPTAQDPSSQDCGAMTPEVSLGAARGKAVKLAKDEPASRFPPATRDGELAYRGRWELGRDFMRSADDNPRRKAYLRLICRGLQVFAVLAPAGASPALFYVRQDGIWLQPGNSGKDVEFDDDGRSFVRAEEPRLYELVRNPDDSVHELTLTPMRRGSAVYDFSFADRCLPLAPPE